ncbi:hypothetical protein AMECASPLE_038342 [Ameca splendens]|uniref:Uncharacterized protein n=1 Tax=Ameca splendens TaxID=208324 RepID=A0ABV0Z6T5_9TELE
MLCIQTNTELLLELKVNTKYEPWRINWEMTEIKCWLCSTGEKSLTSSPSRAIFRVDPLYIQVFVCLLFMYMNFDDVLFLIYKLQFIDGPTVASSINFNYSVSIFHKVQECVHSWMRKPKLQPLF